MTLNLYMTKYFLDPASAHQKPVSCDPFVKESLGGRFLGVEAVLCEAEGGVGSGSCSDGGAVMTATVVLRSTLLGGERRVVRRLLRDLHLLHASMTHTVPDATMDYYVRRADYDYILITYIE